MANVLDLRVDYKKLARLFDKLPEGFDSKYMNSLLRFSAKPTVRAAQNKAPLDTGVMAESLGVISLRKAKTASIVVGPRVRGKFKVVKNEPTNRGGWYGHFVEFGTVRQEADPFMRPAWDQTQDVFTKRFMDNAKRRLELTVKRLEKKGVI